MNASKQKGTWFESALVQWFQAKGMSAHRLVQHGNKDIGDIDVGDINLEAKNCKAISLGTWIKETEVEAANAGKPVILVVKRMGISDVGKSYVIMTLDTFHAEFYNG